MHSHKRSSLEFAPVMLWAIANALVDIAPIADELILLLSEDEVKELIEALWDAHGNVSKASQKLFLHRNTLQYRIDRFAEQTGLNVKDMKRPYAWPPTLTKTKLLKNSHFYSHRSGYFRYDFYALTASFLGVTFVSLIVTFPF